MMADFLIAYLWHSTALLAAMWLVMRAARPRSPALVERLWKLAAVLPVITALASICRPISNDSVTRTTLIRNDVVESLDDPLTDEPVRATAVSAVPIADDETSFARLTEPWHTTDQSLDVPATNDFAIIELPTERRMDTPARPTGEALISDGAGNPPKADHPPSVSDLGTEFVSSEPNTVEANELMTVESTVVAEMEVDTPSERAESWWLPAWQVTSTLLPAWALIGAIWLLIRSAWFRWRLRNARRIERGRPLGLLRELLPQAQRVRLLIVPGFAEPAAFGLLRPTIVLPPSCESLDREALRAVLAHELGHIARGDLWWLTIGRVLTTVFGFQPLNRIARREWTRAAECLCDDWAVGRGVERLTLARCLTALAEHRLTGVSLADALAAVGSPSSLRTRIERLVAEPAVDPWSRRSRRWLASGSVLAAGVLVAVMLPLPNVLTASVPRPLGSGLNDVDGVQTWPLPDGRSTDEDSADIEAELSGLRTELQHAAQLAEQRHDPFWIDAAESLREREQRIVERWRQWIGR